MNDLFNVSAHRKAIACFRSAAVEELHSSRMDPLSFALLFGVPDLCFIPCFLLSFYTIRYSELSQLSIPMVSYQERIQIFQPKVGTTKLTDNGILPDLVRQFSLDINTPLSVVEYDTLRRAVARTLTISRAHIPSGIADATHIFRHLAASWMNFHDSPRWRISEALGHAKAETCSSYIHDYPAMIAGIAKQGG